MNFRFGLLATLAVLTQTFGCGDVSELSEDVATTNEAFALAPPYDDLDGHGYNWSGGIGTTMKSVTTHVCFLARIRDLYRSAADTTFIEGVSPGVWVLRGQAGTGAPKARAFCVGAQPTGLNLYEQGKYDPTEYRWSRSQGGSTDMGPTSNRTCFLTRIKGRLDGANNFVSAHKVSGRWVLDGGPSDLADGVEGSARCINIAQLPTESYSYDSTQQPAGVQLPIINGQWYLLSSSTDGPACALTRLGGNFSSDWRINAGVELRPSGATSFNWFLGGSGNGQRLATGRCIF